MKNFSPCEFRLAQIVARHLGQNDDGNASSDQRLVLTNKLTVNTLPLQSLSDAPPKVVVTNLANYFLKKPRISVPRFRITWERSWKGR